MKKKITALLLAAAMLFAVAVPLVAEDGDCQGYNTKTYETVAPRGNLPFEPCED